MSPLTMFSVLSALIFSSQLFFFVYYRGVRRYLAEQPPAMPPGGWPKLAVLVAARNEEKHVEQAVRTLLALDYPGLTVVAVDDRSTDGTGAALARLAATDPRLTVKRIDELPHFWLGKTNALQQAADAAGPAEWLLFTDADVQFAPDALRRAVAYATASRADHVTIYPEMHYDSPGEAIFLAFFGLALGLQMPAWRVEMKHSRSYLGIGAFNLVSRAAFTRIGGFAHLSLSVDDDMRLGEALKAHGFQTRILHGLGAVWLKWQPDALGYVRGLEKNAFASLEFSYLRLTAALGGLFFIGPVPYLALAFGSSLARTAALVAIASTVGLVGLARRSTGIPAVYGLTAPIAALLLGAAAFLSAGKTRRRGGIVWRDTLYPIADLKRHVRERAAWVNAAWKSAR